MTPSQAQRKRKPARRRPPRDCYSEGAYRRAIHRACDQAFPPPKRLRRQMVRRRTGWYPENDAEYRQRLGEGAWEELKQWQARHRWCPNQLRHNAGTYLRKRYGLDAARAVLGHSTPVVTEVYAELDLENARRIMREIG